MLTIKMDKRPIEALENDLDKFHDRALPYAVRDTLNTLAYETSRIAKKNADRLMVMRNTYTSRSIQFERAQGLKVDQMKSAAGSLQEYMREQEEGFTRHKKGKHGVPVPTSFAAGQQGAVPRSKPIRRVNWMNRLKVAKGIRKNEKYKTTKQTVLRRVQEAIASGNRYIVLGVREKTAKRYKKGIYQVLGGKLVKRGWPHGARLKLVYALDQPSITTMPRRWLEPSANLVISKREEYYRKALIRQIEKNRLFRDKR